MSAADKLKELVKAQEKLRKELNKKYEEERALQAEMTQIALQVCMEEKLFQKHIWELEFYPKGVTLRSRVGSITRLSELLQSNYHCSVSMADGELRFDDNDVSLWFNSKEKAKAFVIDNKLGLHTTRFIKQKQEYETNLKEIDGYLEFIYSTNSATVI